jgi:hypothetical protein
VPVIRFTTHPPETAWPVEPKPPRLVVVDEDDFVPRVEFDPLVPPPIDDVTTGDEYEYRGVSHQ